MFKRIYVNRKIRKAQYEITLIRKEHGVSCVKILSQDPAYRNAKRRLIRYNRILKKF